MKHLKPMSHKNSPPVVAQHVVDLRSLLPSWMVPLYDFTLWFYEYVLKIDFDDVQY